MKLPSIKEALKKQLVGSIFTAYGKEESEDSNLVAEKLGEFTEPILVMGMSVLDDGEFYHLEAKALDTNRIGQKVSVILLTD